MAHERSKTSYLLDDPPSAVPAQVDELPRHRRPVRTNSILARRSVQLQGGDDPNLTKVINE
jgi:hypothetical protein